MKKTLALIGVTMLCLSIGSAAFAAADATGWNMMPFAKNRKFFDDNLK